MSELVAVTGATGFIGSHLARALSAQGTRVRALARGEGTRASAVAWVRGDLDDASALDDLVRGARVVVHLAARVHARDATAAEHERVNAAGTRRVCEAAVRAGVVRIVYASSTAVYGDAPQPWRESSTPSPVSAYGRAKLAGEASMREVLARSDASGVILRPTAVVGPGAPGSFHALERAASLGVVPLVGGGRACKSLVDVTTVVDAIVRGIAHPVASGACVVFNVADERAASVLRISEAIAMRRDAGARLLSVPRPVARVGARVADRALEMLGRERRLGAVISAMSSDAVADGTLAREVLGVRIATTALERLARESP